MKKNFPLTIFLFWISAFAQAQLVSPKRLADSLYEAKSYAAAAGYYLQAAAKDDFKALAMGNYYNAACCFALAGNTGTAMENLKKASSLGILNPAHLKNDTDLNSLHELAGWDSLVSSLKEFSSVTSNPDSARLVTSDLHNFWKAYDLVQTDTANRSSIYKKYYIDAGSPGLQDYFAMKVHNLDNFVRGHDKRKQFYAAIRKNTLTVESQKPMMVQSFRKFKELYADAKFPDVYFIIGSFTSGGTVSDKGLLLGIDQTVRTPDIPLDELTLWQRNNFNDLSTVPNLVAHELIHFNQDGMAGDTSLLKAVLVEGMADYIGFLISGKSANERLHTWAKGKEKQVWIDFEKEMYLSRARNWIANSDQETADKPADLGYWVGFQICKAYYDNSKDKKQAVYDMLNIKDYKQFYEKSRADQLFR